MNMPRTAKIFTAIIFALILLAAPAAIFPAYLDSPFGILFAVPLLSIYLFHSVGLPGLLEHGGACDWGWCAPSILGWLFAALFWSLVLWVISAAIARITNDRRH